MIGSQSVRDLGWPVRSSIGKAGDEAADVRSCLVREHAPSRIDKRTLKQRREMPEPRHEPCPVPGCQSGKIASNCTGFSTASCSGACISEGIRRFFESCHDHLFGLPRNTHSHLWPHKVAVFIAADSRTRTY